MLPQVVWQFVHDGEKLYGATLTRKLGEVRVIEGSKVTFSWSEGSLHSIHMTRDQAVYEACDVAAATEVSPFRVSETEVLTPDLGVTYYFDGFGSNCAVGKLKIIVRTFTSGACACRL